MNLKIILLSLITFSQIAHSRIIVTNQPVDLLIVGKASLGLINEDGMIEYTDDGSFIINKDGDVIDSFNRKLYPGFKLPKDTASILINLKGYVDVYLKNKKSPLRLGQIALFKSEDDKNYSNITGADHNIEIHQGKLYIK